MIRDDVEITCGIGISIIDSRGNPLAIYGECTERRLDGAGRAERVRVITFRSADSDSLGMVAKDLFDRRRFRAVIELRRTGVCIDVVDLLGHQLRVCERFSHRTNTRFAVRQG